MLTSHSLSFRVSSKDGAGCAGVCVKWHPFPLDFSVLSRYFLVLPPGTSYFHCPALQGPTYQPPSLEGWVEGLHPGNRNLQKPSHLVECGLRPHSLAGRRAPPPVCRCIQQECIEGPPQDKVQMLDQLQGHRDEGLRCVLHLARLPRCAVLRP